MTPPPLKTTALTAPAPAPNPTPVPAPARLIMSSITAPTREDAVGRGE